MKTNVYLLSYAPLIGIILFSMSLAIATSEYVIQWLNQIGVYSEIIELLSVQETKVLVLVLVVFFTIFYSEPTEASYVEIRVNKVSFTCWAFMLL